MMPVLEVTKKGIRERAEHKLGHHVDAHNGRLSRLLSGKNWCEKKEGCFPASYISGVV